MNIKLRHGLPHLTPSEMASQFYCEYKVHLSRLHPRAVVEVPQLQAGTRGHEELASEAEAVTKAEIEKRIKAGQAIAICEKEFSADFDGVQINGRPDFFLFQSHRSFLILEFKFTNSIKPYTDQIAQVQIYALLSELMGFIPDELVLGIVLLPPIISNSEVAASSSVKLLELQQQIQGTLQMVCQACERARRSMLGKKKEKHEFTCTGARVYLARHNSDQAKKYARWALEYWLGKREPLPVGKMPFDSWKKKCTSCHFNAMGLCEHALDKPSKEMVARLDGSKSIQSSLPVVT